MFRRKMAAVLSATALMLLFQASAWAATLTFDGPKDTSLTYLVDADPKAKTFTVGTRPGGPIIIILPGSPPPPPPVEWGQLTASGTSYDGVYKSATPPGPGGLPPNFFATQQNMMLTGGFAFGKKVPAVDLLLNVTSFTFLSDSTGMLTGINGTVYSRSHLGELLLFFPYLDPFTEFSGVFNINLTETQGGKILLTDFTVSLQPVPEPGTMMLLGSGLAGLIGCCRRRMKK